MFTEREYQVKDIMELYGITRDTIKYYENHGLIQSKRKKNGYRVFDEINVRKLKKILAFRDLGMTVEEVLEHCNSESIAERVEIMTRVRHRLEDELKEVNRKLRKVREMERHVSENPRFADGFNVAFDLKLCTDCPYMTVTERKSFAVLSAVQGQLSAEGELCGLQECELLLNEDLGKEQCYNCPRLKHYKQYYRNRIQYRSEEELRRLIRVAYSDMKLMGYETFGEIYMMRKIIKNGGSDVLILDTMIPFESKEH